MDNVLETLSADERRRQQAAYLAHLRRRDGAPDLDAGTLAHREAFFREIDGNPLRYTGEVPRDEFARRMATKDVTGASRMALWMSVMASTNEGERYAVGLAIEDRKKLPKATLADDPMTYVEIEELYHTRILLDALRVLGLEWEMREPEGAVRAFLWSLIRLPRWMSNPVVLMGEIAGTIIFLRLRETARELFGTETPEAKRIQALIEEILVDEIGHVAYVRSKMGPVEMAVARVLLTLGGRLLFLQTPAIAALWDVGEMAREARAMRWSLLPPEIRARAFTSETAVDGSASASA
ncbi:MAG: hypothetical protein ACK4YP_25275 [Myxococcota bacterium]